MIYHLASKCHSSNAFPVWGPTAERTGYVPGERSWHGPAAVAPSSQHPAGN